MDPRESAADDLKQCLGSVRQVITSEQFFCGTLVSRPRKKQDALSRANKESQIAALREAVRGCTRCALHAGRTQTVFGEGDLNASVVFVGEAPGEEEETSGRPFTGEAGQLLTKIIAAMGLTREAVYITNVLACRPPQNRDPQPEEEAQCRPYLVALLQIIKPRVICALGSHPAQALLGGDRPISQRRGIWHEFEGIALLPTFGPAHLLRVPRDKQLVWQDVKKIVIFLNTA